MDKQTAGLGESSSSHSNSSICSNCNTKITADDFMNHILTCQAHTGEMGFQTIMGKYFFFCFQCNLIKINFDVWCARKDIKVNLHFTSTLTLFQSFSSNGEPFSFYNLKSIKIAKMFFSWCLMKWSKAYLAYYTKRSVNFENKFLKYIMKNWEDKSLRCNAVKTPLHFAAMNGNLATFKDILGYYVMDQIPDVMLAKPHFIWLPWMVIWLSLTEQNYFVVSTKGAHFHK